MKKALLIVAGVGLTVLLSASLLRKKEPIKTPSGCSFYYWKTSLSFNKADKALADSLGVERLYLRYFDVDWSPTLEMPVPVGKLDMGSNFNGSFNQVDAEIGDYQVIPTIYLVNRIFEKNFNADTLATRISRKIAEYNDNLSYQTADWGNNYEKAEEPSAWYLPDSLMPYNLFQNRIKEIQLDCDWTLKTRDRYFKFLKAMKKANPGMTISCTVRLHQFRDKEQAGIPPVDRGTLMCYNMAAPKDMAVRDAVFDTELVNGYLKNGEYPLALEAALPLFGWGALFHENQFKGLAAGLSENEVKGNPLFEPVAEGKYRFMQDTVFANAYMRQGDIVRLDAASPAEVAELASQLSKIKAVKNISFFDWNPTKIREYHVDEICKKFGR
ncbi:MAG: hypothetical protein IPN76_09115 [Saprospiraceae bacterium]|nr:hypothetical protein [Saprospiraceae bacterium]